MTGSSWRAKRLSLGIGLALATMAPVAHAQVPRNPLGDNPLGQPNVQVRSLEVRDITLGAAGGASITFGRIAFSGFAREGDTVRADRANFENISAKFLDFKIDVPILSVADLKIPSELFRAFSEGGSLDRDWAGLLTASTISEIKADTIVSVTDTQDEFREEGVVLRNLANGMLASYDSNRLSGGSSRPGETVKMSLGPIRARDINFAEFVRFARGGGSGSAKTLLASAVAENLEVVSADTTVRMARFEMTGINGRAPQMAPPASSAAAAGLGGDAINSQLSAKYAQEVFRYLAIDRYSVRGLEITAPDANVTLGELALTALSAKGIGSFQIRDINVTAPTGPAKLANFAIERINYAVLVERALEAAATGKEPDFQPGQVLDYAPRIGAIRLTGLDLATPAGPFVLGDFRFEMDDRPGQLPEKILLALTGLKVDLSSMDANSGAEKLVALGYREIAANAQLQLRWSPAERSLVLDDSGLVIDRAGRIDLNAKVGGVKLVPFPSGPAEFEQALGTSTVESVTLQIRNLGLAERIFAEIAKSAGVSPDAIRAGVAAEVKNQVAAILGPALASGSGEAIESFIRSSKSLVIRATPRAGQPPLTVGELQGMAPPQILGRVSIKVEAPAN